MFLIFEMILFSSRWFSPSTNIFFGIFASNALGISHIIANDLIGYMIDDSSQLEDLKNEPIFCVYTHWHHGY